MPLKNSKMRVARPSTNLTAAKRFYLEALGLELLSHFEDHDSFDGFMAGYKGSPFHIEITFEHGFKGILSPSPEDLIIFYVSDKDEWLTLTNRIEEMGYKPIPAGNAYWDERGITYVDPDGYRVVIENDEGGY